MGGTYLDVPTTSPLVRRWGFFGDEFATEGFGEGGWPLGTSQSRTRFSQSQEASVLPSGVKATPLTSVGLGDRSTRTSRPLATSQR